MTQPQATKDEIGKFYFIKIKNICGSKETIKKVKRQPTKWEKVFASYICDKTVTPKIYKELQ